MAGQFAHRRQALVHVGWRVGRLRALKLAHFENFRRILDTKQHKSHPYPAVSAQP